MLIEPVKAPARWWPCAFLHCVSGLRGLDKTLNFLRCKQVIDLELKYGSDINEGNCLQLLFYFCFLLGMVACVIGLSFFSYVSGFRFKFSRIALWRKRLQLDSKSDLTTKVLILGFFNGKWLRSLTSYLYGLNFSRIAHLLFFFWRHQFFSMFSFRGILVCSSKMVVLFGHRILQYRLVGFSNALQLCFLFLCVFLLLFSGSSGRNLWLLLKIT